MTLDPQTQFQLPLTKTLKDHKPTVHEIYQRRRPEQTVLYKVVQENWETFQAQVSESQSGLPKHVVKEFYEFLDCGILAKGFLRIACTDCRKERLVAFSCRGRSFCPGCMGRRMNETAVFLVDHVLPQLPIRQWVLSFPFQVRYLLAKNPRHITRVLKITLRVIDGFYKKQGGKVHREKKLKTGAVTAIQRFGGSVNLNVHFHALIPDGVFHVNKSADGTPTETFMRTSGPQNQDVKQLVEILAKRILSYFKRQGLLDGTSDHLNEDQTDFMDQLNAASVSSKIALGPRAGQRVRRYGQIMDVTYEPTLTGHKCAYYQGFSLHANTRCEVWERTKLENLCKYINRPPIANERLSITQSGNVLYKMKAPYQDGTTHLQFAPLEFIEKLSALVPPPRMHIIRYHGVFAPHSKARPDIVKRNKVLKKSKEGSARVDDQSLVPEKLKAKISWAKLLRRTFQIDITKCEHCGGQTKVLCAIMEKKAIGKILSHLGLPVDPPAIHSARAPPQTRFDLH